MTAYPAICRKCLHRHIGLAMCAVGSFSGKEACACTEPIESQPIVGTVPEKTIDCNPWRKVADPRDAEIVALRSRAESAERERDEQRDIAYSLAMGCPDCGGVGTVPVHNDGDEFDAEKDCPKGVSRSVADTGDYEWQCGCVENICPRNCSAGQAARHLREITSRALAAESRVRDLEAALTPFAAVRVGTIGDDIAVMTFTPALRAGDFRRASALVPGEPGKETNNG